MLRHGNVYTQRQILDSGDRDIILQYHMTEESAKMSARFRELCKIHGGRDNAISWLMQNTANIYNSELLNFVIHNRDYVSPQWDSYLYIRAYGKSFLRNVDFNCPRVKEYITRINGLLCVRITVGSSTYYVDTQENVYDEFMEDVW